MWVYLAIPPKTGYTTHKYCLGGLNHCVWKIRFEHVSSPGIACMTRQRLKSVDLIILNWRSKCIHNRKSGINLKVKLGRGFRQICVKTKEGLGDGQVDGPRTSQRLCWSESRYQWTECQKDLSLSSYTCLKSTKRHPRDKIRVMRRLMKWRNSWGPQVG